MLTHGRLIVIVRLLGGVGNQLFQYACARALAYRRNARLILDLRFFDTYAQWTSYFRNYELYAFHILAETLSIEMLEQLDGEFKYYECDVIGPCEDIETVEFPCYLNGNWQSWKYFSSIESIIRKEFAFKKEIFSSPITKLAYELSGKPSVAIHLRRTDYSQYNNILSLAYYQNAVSYIKKSIPSLQFYVFSDDPEWVSSFLDIPCYFEIIKGNSGLEDLYLMISCRHHIIANSTFSWWAAWLCDNPHKLVIAPDVWYPSINGSVRSMDIDIIPPGWICVSG
jgi:hypothetical protein